MLRRTSNRLPAWSCNLPLVAAPLAATAYLAVFAINARALMRHVYWNSDVASGPLLAERLASAETRPDEQLLVSQPGYLQLDIWTAWLPAHRFIWQWVFGPGLMAVGIALAAWAVARLTSRWTGAIAASVMIAASPEVLYGYLSQAYHTATWASQCALFAFAVWTLTRPANARRWPLVAAATALALVVGYWSASDQLLLIDGIAPFAVGLGAVICTRAGRARRSALAAGAGTIAGSLVTMLAMTATFASGHWVMRDPVPMPSRLATAPEVAKNAGLMAQNMVQVGNGFFFGHLVNGRGLLLLTCAAIAYLGLLAPYALARRQIRASSDSPDAGRLFAGTYWLALQLALMAGFLFTEVASDLSAWRYLAGLVGAIGCTAALWADRRPLHRLVVAAAAVLVCVSATGNVRQFGSDVSADGRDRDLIALLHSLDGSGVRRGYGNYWDAEAVSWNDKSAVTFLAVQGGDGCPADPHGLCPFLLDAASSQYRPHAGTSFYVSDPPVFHTAGLPERPDPGRFGNPIASWNVAGMTVYEYSYDLATRFTGPIGR